MIAHPSRPTCPTTHSTRPLSEFGSQLLLFFKTSVKTPITFCLSVVLGRARFYMHRRVLCVKPRGRLIYSGPRYPQHAPSALIKKLNDTKRL